MLLVIKIQGEFIWLDLLAFAILLNSVQERGFSEVQWCILLFQIMKKNVL